ncbi:MAG TPA: hypothetical protein VII69_13600 [Candidatus Eremiobacteraceae bacterium]
MKREPPWIPPSGLIAAHLAHGASWILLGLLARQGIVGPSMRAFAWVHLVALGWLTLTALAVLLFVVPQFTDAEWRGELSARLGIVVFAFGAFAMVVAFWTGGDSWLWGAASGVVSGLTLYGVPAVMTLRSAMRTRGTEAAIARAFLIVFAFLGAAALIGLGMAGEFASGKFSMLAWAPSVHANLAMIGWLTLLVMGVSARTIGPISGRRSPQRWVHIVSSSLVTAGTLALVLVPWTAAALWPGCILCATGTTVYAVDMLALLARSNVQHRPPQAFMAASMLWLVVTVALGILSVAGHTMLAPAYVFVGLVGWVAQIVLAHLHHIGVRLIATMARGDDDETPPQALLTPNLSWMAFVLFQMAVATGIAALISHGSTLLTGASVAGFAGWVAMTANVARALSKARANLDA